MVLLLKNLEAASDELLSLGLDSWKIVTLLECLLGASTARTSRENLVSMGFVACGSTSFLLGARTSSGVSTGLPSSSANRKHKYSAGGVRPVVSHESEEPRRSNTPGSFLGKRSRHPRQLRLIGDGGGRLATSRPAALSVTEGPIGIPVLFLCPVEPPYLLPSRSPLPGGVWICGVVRLTTPGNRRLGVFC